MILEKESLYNSKSNRVENYVAGYLKAAKESINSAEVLLKEDCGYDAFTLAGHSLQLAINYFCIINKIPYDKYADYSDNLEAIFVSNKKLPLTDYVYEYIGKYLTSIDYPMYGRMKGIDVNEAIEEAKKTILNIEEYCYEVLNKKKK